jgi:ubiquinone/menaquinone biosynthesis C-methylase UbiE
VKDYYDQRAPEYDEWYLGRGRFAGLERPDWEQEVAALERVVRELPPKRTLDVACGTGFITQHLRGPVTALDQSERMLALAARRLPDARLRRGDALTLAFPADAFDRVFTAHFYGHLDEGERLRFLAEARRVAPELVVVDSAARPDHHGAEWQERVLNDGSQFKVYKRYFVPEELALELGGKVVHCGRWFVAVSSTRAS